MEIAELVCNICFEHFGKSKVLPKILTCGHTFCSKCLDSVLNTNNLCGTCREDIQYYSTEEIPVNYAIKSLAEREVWSCDAQIEFCDEHSKSPKNWNCIDCKQIICGSCVMMHHKDCQTEYIDIKKRGKLLTECQRNKEFVVNYSKSLQNKYIKLNTKLGKIEYDILQNEKEQEETANIQRRLQTVDSDSADEYIPSDTMQAMFVESSSIIKNFNIHDLTLKETEMSFYLQQWTDYPIEYEDVVTRLENGESLHAVDRLDNEVRFGRLEHINGTFRVHSFVDEAPAQPCTKIPFRQLLPSLTGSTELPGKVFFQFQGCEEEVIVKTNEALAGSPRVLNFLYFSSGLKGPSYKNKKIYVSDYSVSIRCRWMRDGLEVQDSLVKGIVDGGIYLSPSTRGCVCGGGAASGELSCVIFCFEDLSRKRSASRFGKIESGIEAFEDLRGTPLVHNCGFVIG